MYIFRGFLLNAGNENIGVSFFHTIQFNIIIIIYLNNVQLNLIKSFKYIIGLILT